MDQTIVKFFEKCILKHEKEGRPTRVSNIVGHLAKRQDMREWFYARYSAPSDWINFFHEHPKRFFYDENTGNFKLRQNGGQTEAQNQQTLS